MTARAVTAVLSVAAITAGCHAPPRPSGAAATGNSSPPATVISLEIAGGAVTPTNEEFQAQVKQPIELRVNSDTDDELHVHAVPEHTFTVRPERDQTFTFSVDVPGQVEIELHELGRTVAIIQVQQ